MTGRMSLFFGAVVPGDVDNGTIEVHLIETKITAEQETEEETLKAVSLPEHVDKQDRGAFSSETTEDLSSLQIEARLIARRIIQLQQEMKIWDKGQKKISAG